MASPEEFVGGDEGALKGRGTAEGTESTGLWQSQPLGDRAQERPKGEACCSLCINFVMLEDRKPMP